MGLKKECVYVCGWVSESEIGMDGVKWTYQC